MNGVDIKHEANKEKELVLRPWANLNHMVEEKIYGEENREIKEDVHENEKDKTCSKT